jgi:hypothetical protein
LDNLCNLRQSGRVKGREYSRIRVMARQGKERQGKERQDKERQDKERQDKERQGKERQTNECRLISYFVIKNIYKYNVSIFINVNLSPYFQYLEKLYYTYNNI